MPDLRTPGVVLALHPPPCKGVVTEQGGRHLLLLHLISDTHCPEIILNCKLPFWEFCRLFPRKFVGEGNLMVAAGLGAALLLLLLLLLLL